MKIHDINVCSCGTEPMVTEYFMKGVANKKHYFVKCSGCGKRTRDRKRYGDAVKEWNETEGSLYRDDLKIKDVDVNKEVYKEVLSKINELSLKAEERYGTPIVEMWTDVIQELVEWLQGRVNE